MSTVTQRKTLEHNLVTMKLCPIKTKSEVKLISRL